MKCFFWRCWGGEALLAICHKENICARGLRSVLRYTLCPIKLSSHRHITRALNQVWGVGSGKVGKTDHQSQGGADVILYSTSVRFPRTSPWAWQ